MNDDIIVHFAGICQSGKISYSYTVTCTDTGEELRVFSMTENCVEGDNTFLPEYKAILAALTWLYTEGCHKDKFIRFLSHCAPVIAHMQEKQPLFDHPYKSIAVRCLMAKNEHFWCLEFEEVPEDFNENAMRLAEEKILQIA